MIRSILIVLAFLGICRSAMSQESRSVIIAQPQDWFVFEPAPDVDFQSQSQVLIQMLQKPTEQQELVPYPNAEFTAKAYFVTSFQFETEANWAKHTLKLEDETAGWLISVNGKIVQRQSELSDFIDVTPLLENDGRAVVVLTRNTLHGIQRAGNNFQPKLVQGVSFQNVAVKQLKLTDDAFFGGQKIEAVIENFGHQAIDGKLVGRVYKSDGTTLLVENNNCAYARPGVEFVVDIALPESENLLDDGNYVLEVELLDKENGEQVIDALQVAVSNLKSAID